MSKKSTPGDGQHGKGKKGMKKPFEDLFEIRAIESPQQETDDAESAPKDLKEGNCE
jgi:hypothetical protein